MMRLPAPSFQYMNNRAIVFLAAALMAAFLAQSAPRVHSSVEGGTLHGMVTDPSGAAIPGATVIVSSGEFVRNVPTDETGRYTLSELAPGHYSVHIHAAGFAIFGRSGLVLSAGYETEANAQLTISPSRQAVTVSARP
jgi:protocatechuate 3,4-dioxygenase beta subunit